MTWIIKCLKYYAVFKGRAVRQEFTYFTLFVIILQAILLSIDLYIGWGLPNIINGILWFPLFEISRILMVLPILGVTVRRLHDINKSGWWIVLIFTMIGIIPLFYWCFFKNSDLGKNQYDIEPIQKK